MKFTFIRSKPDARDFLYERTNKALRESVDLREYASSVDSQLGVGSCSANAIVNAYELMIRQTKPEEFVDLSRLFVYYNGRTYDNSENEDEGLYLRDGFKAVQEFGICTEELWPYDVDKVYTKPSEAAYEDGKKRTIKSYNRLKTITDVIDALNDNKPVVIGIDVFENFLNPVGNNSVIASPLNASQESLGTHAVCLVGYDTKREIFIAKNSFGDDWGDGGYAYLTYDYVRNHGFDMWVFEISDGISTELVIIKEKEIESVVPKQHRQWQRPVFYFALRKR